FVESEDIHGDVSEGIARAELTVGDFGRRRSTYRAFLKPAMRRHNLTVVSRALTTRVRLDRGRAVGVDYLQNGRVVAAAAGRRARRAGGGRHAPPRRWCSGHAPPPAPRRR